jgi:hypothetical protein
MSCIVYGGIKYIRIRHAIQCKKCLETIESKHRYDFKYCTCKLVGIDGGISDGSHIIGNISDIENRSIYYTFIQNKKIYLPQFVIESNTLPY